jgi:long-chain acyl-CoA synthetase
VARIIIAKEPWSIENGLLTPTLKLKRVEIEKTYDAIVDKSHSESVGWEQ